jgi:hypothetical protein
MFMNFGDNDDDDDDDQWRYSPDRPPFTGFMIVL